MIFFTLHSCIRTGFCGPVVIPEVIDDIRSKLGTFDWLMAN